MKHGLLVLIVACSAPQRPPYQGATEEGHSALADEDEVKPTYSKADLEKTLIAERGAEATDEHRVADLDAKGDADALPGAIADLAVRRRFIAALEACQSAGHWCPPRLDEPPPLGTGLRFDLADWQKLAADLHGRACACRTIACIDGMDDTIAQLEARPMSDVQADETATASITHARECLFRLRGKAIAKLPTD